MSGTREGHIKTVYLYKEEWYTCVGTVNSSNVVPKAESLLFYDLQPQPYNLAAPAVLCHKPQILLDAIVVRHPH